MHGAAVAFAFGRKLATDHLRDAVAAHRNAVERIGRFHRPLLVRNDDELSAVTVEPQQFKEAPDIQIVERSFDLVEDVERTWLGQEDGEQEEAPTAEDQKVRMLLSLLSIFLIRSISFLRPVSINLLPLSGYLTFYMEASKLSLIIFQGKKYLIWPMEAVNEDVCLTSLPLASSKWAQSTLSSQCALTSKKRH